MNDLHQSYEITKAELQEMLIEASAKGSRAALDRLGLHDENAANDIRELRGLLDSWREAKHTAWKTIIDWATKIFLGALLLGLYMKSDSFKNFLK